MGHRLQIVERCSVLLVGHLPGMYLTQWPVPGLYLAHSALSLWNVSGGKIKSKRGLILPHRVSARMTCKHSGPRCLCHWGSVRVVVLVVGEAVTNLPGRTELCRSARTRFHMHQHSDGQNKRKLKNKQTGSWSPPSSSWSPALSLSFLFPTTCRFQEGHYYKKISSKTRSTATAQHTHISNTHTLGTKHGNTNTCTWTYEITTRGDIRSKKYKRCSSTNYRAEVPKRSQSTIWCKSKQHTVCSLLDV